MRVPGGGASCLGVGRRGSGALPPPTARPLGGLPRPTTHWLWVRQGAGVGTCHQPHSARSCVLWGRLEGARGGRLLPGCGASGVGRSPTPDCLPSGRAAEAHYPLAVGAGGCGRGNPSPTPQRALLRAGFARCGGGTGAPRGGTSCLGVRPPGSVALPPLTVRLWAGCRGPLPTGCGCGGVQAWGPVPNPTACALASWLCSLWGRHEGARGGAPPAWVWGVRGRALSHPRLPDLWAGCWGPLPTGCWCGGGAGVGTRHQPHSARSCELALRAVGAARGRPGGAPPAWLWGVRGRSLSHPRLPALWAGCRGPLPTGCGCGGVQAWGPVPNPTARALASWLCALWGPHEGARGGGASCLRVGRPGSGALPPPTARPLGGLPGPTTHLLWVRGGAGVVTRHQPHSARSCVLWGQLEGARGGRLLPGCAASGVGRSPTPDCPSSGRAAGTH